MLPEAAWGLKPGRAIWAQAPEHPEPFYGHVYAVRAGGMSVAEYMASGFSMLEALQRQHDGPTVHMRMACGHIIPWRPDYVHYVIGDYTVQCATCGVVVGVKLPLHVFERMQQGQPPDFIFEGVDPIIAAMILQSRCGEHACIP